MTWLADNWMWVIALTLLADIAKTLRGMSAEIHRPGDEAAASRVGYGVDRDAA